MSKEKKKRQAYKHLTKTDRLRIEKWNNEGYSKAEIAKKLRVSKPTIYRELKRGRYEKLDGQTWLMIESYSADIAQQRYEEMMTHKGPDLKIGKEREWAEYIENMIIEHDYSPEAALAAAKEAGFAFTVSKTTLYSYIEKGIFLNLTLDKLPRHGKKKQKYHKVKKQAKRAPAGESIEKRPEEVEGREVFGHWEGDTVYSGKGKKRSRAGLLTITERKTRKEIIIKIPNRQAETVIKAMDALERKYGATAFRMIFKSITFDNGSEFAEADKIEASCINKTIPRTKVFFAHPYSSFERGTNENQNGMIRRKHPKGTNFDKITKRELKETEEWMNNYPRRTLGYRTSNKLFEEELAALGLSRAG